MTKSREYRLAESAQSPQREVEIQLLPEREKALNRNLASAKKALAGVNVKNASLRLACENTDNRLANSQADIELALKVVAEPA